MKKIEEVKEFDTIEENLKDYKNNRRKTLLALLNVVGLFFSVWQLASLFPHHVEQFFPRLVHGVPINEGYDALNLGVPAEGTRLINEVEADLAQLKEDAGIYYHVIVPMTKKEAKQQIQKEVLFQSNQDWSKASMFGYTLELSFDEHVEFMSLLSSYTKGIKNDEILIKTEFTNIVKELIKCEYEPYYSIEVCLFGLPLEQDFYDIDHLSKKLIDRYKDEFVVKGKIFQFAVYKEYVQSKGYNLEDYLPD